jgi:hypothetical protein
MTVLTAPSDGRAFTSYMSAGQREEMLQRKYGTVNENAYRRYLQQNADKVARDLQQFVPPVLAYPPRRK